MNALNALNALNAYCLCLLLSVYGLGGLGGEGRPLLRTGMDEGGIADTPRFLGETTVFYDRFRLSASFRRGKTAIPRGNLRILQHRSMSDGSNPTPAPLSRQTQP